MMIVLHLLCNWLCYSVNMDGEKIQVKLVKKNPIATERSMPYPPFERKGYKPTIIQGVPMSNLLSTMVVHELHPTQVTCAMTL